MDTSNFNVDEYGRIIIDSSMSEELKAKIMEYNSYCTAGDVEDTEISDEEADAYTDDYIEGYNDDYESDSASNNVIEEVAADQETLDDLNDLFN